MRLNKVYNLLMKEYGPQGWWPLSCLQRNGCSYHKGDYSYPKNSKQRFEICVGAILTQNTSWKNVEKALLNLKGNIDAKKIVSMSPDKLAELIRPAGYFNQKAKKLKIFSKFFLNLKKTPSRDELLSIWGIGPETADSILLYAYNIPSFVIDAYTKRFLIKLKLADEKTSYDDMKKLFEKVVKKEFKVYQEYHALIVEHAKRYYSKKPYGKGDWILR